MSTAPPTGQGRIITFYSYKGGTGRSMALANVAWLLAVAGRKVLVIDWDLEAPGLHRYFRPFLTDPDLTTSEGLIDFAIDFVEKASELKRDEDPAPDWYKQHANLLQYAVELDYEFSGAGTIDFIPAGQQNSSYAARVNSFNWKHFYEKLRGWPVFEEARRRMREQYDYILIDSRTGVSDTSGICTVQMPDDLVVCFTLNLQSVNGAAAAAAYVLHDRAARGFSTRIFPVAMRVDKDEKIKTQIMKQYARPKFFAVLPETMSEEEKERYWGECEVPYEAFYAFEENLAYFRDDPKRRGTLLEAMAGIARSLAELDFAKLPVPSPDVLQDVIAKYDAFSLETAIGRPQSRGPSVYLSWPFFHLDKQLASAVDKLALPIIWSGGSDADHLLTLTESAARALRSAELLTIVVGSRGFRPHQTHELIIAEALQRSGENRRLQVQLVCLPGARIEMLPRLLLGCPYADLTALMPDEIIPRFAASLTDPLKEPLFQAVCPYPGLQPFSEEDEPVFFGRESAVRQLVQAVVEGGSIALIGRSGSGKTSCMRAGLIPRLIARSTAAEYWRVSTIQAAQLRSPETLPTAGPADRHHLAVIELDDFVPSAQDVNGLTRLNEFSRQERCAVLFVAESLEQMLVVERIWSMPIRATVMMSAMSADEISAAVAEPAGQAGVRVEPALLNRLAEELAGNSWALPLLQATLLRMWQTRGEDGLTLAGYLHIGSKEAIDRWCEELFAACVARESEASVLSDLSRLVKIETSRQPRAVPDLDISSLKPFVHAGLILVGTDPSGRSTARLTNTLMLTFWRRFRVFLEENREFLVWRTRLEPAVELWAGKSSNTATLRGDALAEASRWRLSHGVYLSRKETEYIRASEEEAKQHTPLNTGSMPAPNASRAMPRRRWALALIAAAVVLISAASFWAYSQRGVSQEHQILVENAASSVNLGDTSSAIEILERALKTRPQDSAARKMLAEIYTQTGRPADGVRELTRVLEESPADDDARRKRGDALAQLGATAAAALDYSNVRLPVSYPILNRRKGQFAVVVYEAGITNVLDREVIARELTKAGFAVHRLDYGISQPPNSLWCSGDVPADILLKVVRILNDSGVAIRGSREASVGPSVMQIGYSEKPVQPEWLRQFRQSLKPPGKSM